MEEDLEANHPAAAPIDKETAIISTHCHMGRAGSVATGVEGAGGSFRASSMAIRTSANSCMRFFGCLCRHWRMSDRATAGVSGGKLDQSGSDFTTEAMISVTVSPLNAGSAVNVSNST